MSKNGYRLEWFDGYYGGQKSSRPTIPSPHEAQTIIDVALRKLGIDPQKATDPEGWRHIGLGSADGLINVIEWEKGMYFLVVWSPILRVPEDNRLQSELFETLLRLNHHTTGMARASLQNDLILLSFVRPIHGLQVDEVVDAIRMVMMAADAIDEPLQRAFRVDMPQIEMDRNTWQGVRDIFRLCDVYTQGIFRYLIEGWVKRNGTITTAGNNSIALRARFTKDKTVAALIGYASAGPLVTVGWDSLRRVWGLREQDEIAFKQSIPRPKRFKVTESSAHLPVDQSFTQEMAESLLDSLSSLDDALKHATPPDKQSVPDLAQYWDLKIRVGGATQRGIHALLASCTPSVQKVYCTLIQGWHDAGQKIYTTKLDRVALRLSVDRHTISLCTLYAPQGNRAPRLELWYPLLHYFDNHVEARRQYEQAIARIPQFTPHNSGGRITMDNGFSVKQAKDLLKVLCRLAEGTSQRSST